MEEQAARILIGGTNSGCGKTTLTCALLSAFVQRNLNVASFKCGPDYIDPMFHGKIIGVPSANLDPFFYDGNTLRYLLAQHAGDLSIIEGVMGFFDGLQMHTTEASTYDVAKKTKTPVILALNAKGTAYSILPIIEGFAQHKNDYHLAGIILNNTTKGTFSLLKPMIEAHFDGAIKVFGYLPKLSPDLVIESRHLGLVTANEIADIQEKLHALGKIASECIDLDAIFAAAQLAPSLSYEPITLPSILPEHSAPHTQCQNCNCDDTQHTAPVSAVETPVPHNAQNDCQEHKLTIAVALDNAFCFYYQDNFRLLEQLGAELIYFSPLTDTMLPPCDGLYLGGGYPELYAQQLAANEPMKTSIRQALIENTPCIAECGGFMYLTEAIDTQPMVGFLQGTCHNTKKLSRFGYATFAAEHDNVLCKQGECFRGHEFHYYDCTENGADYTATKPSGKQWQAVHSSPVLYAGFPHICFYANPNIAIRFLETCKEKHDEKCKTNGH